MTFDPAAIAAFKAYALARWPQEACGLITPVGYVPCRNIAADPLIDFEVAPKDYLMAGEVLAVMHSHTHSKTKAGDLVAKPIDAPSLADQTRQPASGVPWGVSCVTAAGEQDDERHITEPFFFGDQIGIPDLIGRPFRWGVSDCYSLVRDWFRLRNVVLPNVPRELGWEHEADHFAERFADAGFAVIGEDEVREGDVALMRVHFDRPNHCGVVVGGGLLLDHLVGRLSGRRPISTVRGQITHWLRHESMA